MKEIMRVDDEDSIDGSNFSKLEEALSKEGGVVAIRLKNLGIRRRDPGLFQAKLEKLSSLIRGSKATITEFHACTEFDEECNVVLLEALGTLKELRTIDLGFFRSGLGLSGLAPRTYDSGKCSVLDVGTLCQCLQTNPKLEVLILKDFLFKFDNDTKNLAAALKEHKLSELCLEGCGLVDEDIPELLPLLNSTSLIKIDLSNNLFSEKWVSYLKSLAAPPKTLLIKDNDPAEQLKRWEQHKMPRWVKRIRTKEDFFEQKMSSSSSSSSSNALLPTGLGLTDSPRKAGNDLEQKMQLSCNRSSFIREIRELPSRFRGERVFTTDPNSNRPLRRPIPRRVSPLAAPDSPQQPLVISHSQTLGHGVKRKIDEVNNDAPATPPVSLSASEAMHDVEKTFVAPEISPTLQNNKNLGDSEMTIEEQAQNRRRCIVM